MLEDLLKIKTSRFEANRPLAIDVFIHLALNKRTIRVAVAGDFIEAAFLEKIAKRGIDFLYIRHDPNKGKDAETYPLFVDSPASENIEPKTVAALANGSILERTATGEPEGTLLEKNNSNKGEVGQPTESVQKSALGGSAEDSQKTSSSSDSDALTEKTFSQDSSKEDPIQSFQRDPSETSEQTFSADAAEKEAIQKISGKSDSEQNVEEFRFKPSGAPTKEAIFTVSSEGDETVAEPVVLKLSRRLELAKESMIYGDSPNLEAEKEEILEEARFSIISEKVSDEIIRLSGKLPEAQEEEQTRIKSDVSELKEDLIKISAGKEIPENVEKRFPIEKEMKEFETLFTGKMDSDKVINLSEKLAALTEKRETALNLADGEKEEEISTLKRSSTSRDLPTTVSYLASLLGHSLGYVNVDFLADLALGAILHFAKKEGTQLESMDECPAFTKLVLSEENVFDHTVEDSREILRILDAYILDPECDRADKFFVKKVFEKTLNELSQSKVPFDNSNVQRWSFFIEKGETMDAHSICTKASAIALKRAKATA